MDEWVLCGNRDVFKIVVSGCAAGPARLRAREGSGIVFPVLAGPGGGG